MDWTEVELRREAWAQRQDPPLATTKRVTEMLGRKTAAGIKELMARYGVRPQRFPAEQDSRVLFYNLADVEEVVEQHRANTSRRRSGTKPRRLKEEAPARVRLDGVDLSRLPRKGWSRDQAIAAWGRKNGHNAVVNLCDRCPSFYLLPLNEALALVADLTSAPEQVGQLQKARRDRADFRSAARRLASGTELARLERAIDSCYHQGRNFCRLDPVVAAAILLELLRTK